MKKKHRIIRNLLIDAVAAGLALTVFALFHHVLPRQQESLNVQIVNPGTALRPAAKPSARTEAKPAGRRMS